MKPPGRNTTLYCPFLFSKQCFTHSFWPMFGLLTNCVVVPQCTSLASIIPETQAALPPSTASLLQVCAQPQSMVDTSKVNYICRHVVIFVYSSCITILITNY